MKSKIRWWLLFLTALFLVIAVFLATNVDNHITPEDEIYLDKIRIEGNIPKSADGVGFEGELRYINLILVWLDGWVSGEVGIPINFTREPKDLYYSHSGLCYDKSRLLEKLLRSAGFKTRHLSAFRKIGEESKIRILMTPGSPSHALTEVLTSKGWMVITSNRFQYFVDEQGEPMTMEDIQRTPEKFKAKDPGFIEFISTPFFYINGLYSRHGRFYPPFLPVPDINWVELFDL